MSTFDAVDHYFSGQGVVLMGSRDSSGNAKGLFSVGNCSAVKISIATTTLEHKESHTGQRGTDLRLATDIKATMDITLENFKAKSLATALRGGYTRNVAATVTAQAAKAYLGGAVVSIGKMSVSAVAVKRGATALTAYTADTTPFDYKLNADAGSIQFNDGSVQPYGLITTGGTAPSAIAVGYPTDVTVAIPAGWAVGDQVVFSGFTGADAALVNKLPFTTVAGAGVAGHVYLDLDTTGKTITLGTPLSCFDGQAITIDYTYSSQYLIDALSQGLLEVWVRFEGLNTAEPAQASGTYPPVTVDCYRFSPDPLKDFNLIADGIEQFVLSGSLLADSTKATGSKYFITRTTL